MRQARRFIIKNGHFRLSASPPLFLLQIKEKEIEKKDKSMLCLHSCVQERVFFVEDMEETGGNRTETAPK
jgi:hypothetical protein